MRSRMLTMTLGLAILAPCAAQAQSGAHYWSSNGAGCAVGDPAIQFDRYFITAGSVNYKAGASGLVTVYCPVSSGMVFWPFDGWVPSCPSNAYRLRLTYTDSDGHGASTSVTAQLLFLSKENGAFLGPVPGAVLDSNTSSTTVRTHVKVDFTHSFAFSLAYYYVRVDMNRLPGTTHVATFYGAAVECR